MVSLDREFSVWTFIKADLKRYMYLTRENPESISSIRMALSALSPRFIPVIFCRIAYWSHCYRLMPLAKIFSLINFIIFGIEISPRCRIGRGLILPHTQGTVIGAWSIGENATILQGVTLGARELDFRFTEGARPILGNNVTIGAGAKVLGGLSIGNRTTVGANSVVLQSLPEGVVAVGAPARVIGSTDEN